MKDGLGLMRDRARKVAVGLRWGEVGFVGIHPPILSILGS